MQNGSFYLQIAENSPIILIESTNISQTWNHFFLKLMVYPFSNQADYGIYLNGNLMNNNVWTTYNYDNNDIPAFIYDDLIIIGGYNNNQNLNYNSYELHMIFNYYIIDGIDLIIPGINQAKFNLNNIEQTSLLCNTGFLNLTSGVCVTDCSTPDHFQIIQDSYKFCGGLLIFIKTF